MNTEYEFYIECIGVSDRLLSFRVEIYYEAQFVGKANVVVHHKHEVISCSIAGFGVQNDESCVERIKEICRINAKRIWEWDMIE